LLARRGVVELGDELVEELDVHLRRRVEHQLEAGEPEIARDG
jgi:hypothetical protein